MDDKLETTETDGQSGSSAPAAKESSQVDLSADNCLYVDISDALSEKDKAKFTVHTRTSLRTFRQPDMSVVRQHEEFVWLHDRFEENEEYAGYIIPPAPPRPDFDASREKLQKLGELENQLTKEEFLKMKQELEQEYLATFKKTVAMHEVFLQRLAAHPIFRNDMNFKVFLEYEQDLSVRMKNLKEKTSGIWRNLSQKADEKIVLSGQRDVDEFFEKERGFLDEYYARIRDATQRSEKMTKSYKALADSCIGTSVSAAKLSAQESEDPANGTLSKYSDCMERFRKLENRVQSDFDLKLTDTLRYYLRDAEAAKSLLYRRARALADLNDAKRTLEKSRSRGKEIPQAEASLQLAQKHYEGLTNTAKLELVDFKQRRVVYFKKQLASLADLQMRHAKSQAQLIRQTLASLQDEK